MQSRNFISRIALLTTMVWMLSFVTWANEFTTSSFFDFANRAHSEHKMIGEYWTRAQAVSICSLVMVDSTEECLNQSSYLQDAVDEAISTLDNNSFISNLAKLSKRFESFASNRTYIKEYLRIRFSNKYLGATGPQKEIMIEETAAMFKKQSEAIISQKNLYQEQGIDKGPMVVLHSQTQTGYYLFKNKAYMFPISTAINGMGNLANSGKTPVGHFLTSDKFGGREKYYKLSEETQTDHYVEDDFRNKYVGKKCVGKCSTLVQPETGPREKAYVVTGGISLIGIDEENQNTEKRFIYLHGTNDQGNIGKRGSEGCIRMPCKTFMELMPEIPIGTLVYIL